ncbi:MAG: serine hydrolase [Bacteroidota bacterium]
MNSYLAIFMLLLFSSCTGPDQAVTTNYQGNWEGQLPDPKAFSYNLTIEELASNQYNLTLASQSTAISKQLRSNSDDHIEISISEDTQLSLSFSEDKAELNGFIKSGVLLYHLNLKKSGEKQYTGSWSPLLVEELNNQSIFLGVEGNDQGELVAYPFLGDQRFSGFWAFKHKKQKDTLLFSCFKTGLNFRARLLDNQIQLDILFADAVLASSTLSRSESDWQFGLADPQNHTINSPKQLNDGWTIADPSESGIEQAPLDRMIKDVHDQKLLNTHSVLIAKEGKLAFEAYFDGHNANIPHDMRSAAKSIGSAVIGIAIDDQIIEGVDKKLYDYIPEKYQYTKDALKAKIDLHDLLTMSSGMEVNGKASEDYYQNSDNWLKTLLEAPMKDEPGTYTDYGSANSYLLGVCLSEELPGPLETYIDEKLFQPLGISNYILQTEDTKTDPYFGGGIHLTSRDMLKFGQLYLNQGTWNEKTVISSQWIEASMKKHTRLQDARDKNEYGYQWWHKTYTVDGQAFESVEARGNGGQYIFVIPKLEAVVVITSGNFRRGDLLQQPETILEEYVIPAIKG